MVRVSIANATATHELRRTVLRPDAAIGSAMPGDADDAIHLAAWDGDRVVGAVAILPRPCPARPRVWNALQLRGMAVSAEMRGSGVGSLVFAGAVGIAESRGDEILWCNARTSARDFYERQGMRADGAEFVAEETGLAHYVMWCPVR